MPVASCGAVPPGKTGRPLGAFPPPVTRKGTTPEYALLAARSCAGCPAGLKEIVPVISRDVTPVLGSVETR